MGKSQHRTRVLSKVIDDSSAIRRVSYNPKTEILTVYMQFGTQGQGVSLKYSQVPRNVYEELIAAKSKGGYFNANIRDVFNFLGEN